MNIPLLRNDSKAAGAHVLLKTKLLMAQEPIYYMSLLLIHGVFSLCLYQIVKDVW